MNDTIKDIINDVSNRLRLDIKDEDIYFFTDGATSSNVFSIENKYLIKTANTDTIKTQIEFLQFYKNIPNMQKVVFFNEQLGYICFEYIDGEKYSKNIKLNAEDTLKNIYEIVNKYKEYEYQGYGYLLEDNKTWQEFLTDEVKYSSKAIKELNVSFEKVYKALDNIKEINVPKYLIHGDFGTHNFLISNDKLMVIDPMPVIGDYLYDFYFAILSNANIFNKLEIDYILSFFERDKQYKKDLFIIVLYIRMCRCYVYNKPDFEIYYKLYSSI